MNIEVKMEKEKSLGNQALIRGLRLLDILSNYPNGCPLAKLAELAYWSKSVVVYEYYSRGFTLFRTT